MLEKLLDEVLKDYWITIEGWEDDYQVMLGALDMSAADWMGKGPTIEAAIADALGRPTDFGQQDVL